MVATATQRQETIYSKNEEGSYTNTHESGKTYSAKVVEIARKYQVVKLQQKQGIPDVTPIEPVLKTGEKHLSRDRDGLKLNWRTKVSDNYNKINRQVIDTGRTTAK